MNANSMIISGVDHEEGTEVRIVDNMGGSWAAHLSVRDLFGEEKTILIDTRVLLGALNQLKKLNAGRNRAFPLGSTDYYSLVLMNREQAFTREVQKIGDWISVEEELPDYDKPIACLIRSFDGKHEEVKAMRRVNESDCEWRFMECGSEPAYEYNVVEWVKL